METPAGPYSGMYSGWPLVGSTLQNTKNSNKFNFKSSMTINTTVHHVKSLQFSPDYHMFLYVTIIMH